MSDIRVGQSVWYHPSVGECSQRPDQPWHATICYVHDARRVNLAGFMGDGTPFRAQQVRITPIGVLGVEGGYAEFPPVPASTFVAEAVALPEVDAHTATLGFGTEAEEPSRPVEIPEFLTKRQRDGAGVPAKKKGAR